MPHFLSERKFGFVRRKFHFSSEEKTFSFGQNFIFLRKKKHFLSDKILALPKDDEIVLPEKVERHPDLFVNRITPDFVLLSGSFTGPGILKFQAEDFIIALKGLLSRHGSGRAFTFPD